MSAAVIYPAMWILALVVLIIQGNRYWPVGDETLLVIGAGYILFCVGYEVAVKIFAKSKKNVVGIRFDAAYYHYIWISGISIMIGIAYAMIIMPRIDVRNLALSWVRIRDNVLLGNLSIPYILTVARYFNRVAIWFLTLRIVFAKEYKERRICITSVAIILASSVAVSFVDFSRNDALFTLLPVLFIILMKFPMNNKRNLSILGAAFMLFCIFFCWFMQYRLVESVGKEIPIKSRFDAFLTYLASPIPGLNRNIKEGVLKFFTTEGGGRYTLSGINGFLGRLFGNKEPLLLVQQPIMVGDNVDINVFTFYHWTGMDFGIVYALFWQMLFGFIYGHLFCYSKVNNEYAVIGYSVLSYPLVMMFFQDQYFSIGQSWIILVGFGVLIWLITRIRIGKHDDISSNGNL